jgi:hypothetical protein
MRMAGDNNETEEVGKGRGTSRKMRTRIKMEKGMVV